MKIPQREEIRALYETGEYSLQDAKRHLQLRYANEALDEANYQYYQDNNKPEAFFQLMEVVRYLVNRG